MSMTTLLIGVTAIASLALIFGQRMPRTYANRQCQGKAWRHAFPASSKVEIRQFLTMFVQAFALAEKDKLKLKPDDAILSIYRALNPHAWMADALELKTLSQSIEATHGISLTGLWSEALTLGQLFAAVQQHRQASCN